MKYSKTLGTLVFTSVLVLLSACESAPVVGYCSVTLKPGLASAMRLAEDKLGSGCEYSFDDYYTQLLNIAAENPDAGNKQLFSNFLVGMSDRGIISKRQARNTYNRYFNIKFVSLMGDYNTCSQTCPSRNKVMADMQRELRDKELGLMKASEDSASYHRADHLLKEAQLVLEATCRACELGGS